jgi:hypothetical protein
MTDWLAEHHQNRCEGKKPYRTGEVADRKAESASRKTGHLILSYKCPDCGFWHIGHADWAQARVRNIEQSSNLRFCIVCKRPIPQDRIERAVACGGVTTTCSRQCAKAAQKRRQHLRRQRKPPVS